jgi:gamma-glutamyltranspeptidase/glutathione hydrolase
MISRVPSFAEPGAARRLGRTAFALLLAAGLAGCQSVGDFFGFGSRNNSGVAQGTPGYVRGFLGGVASEDPAASVIARRVLSAGGSATDAAVAAGFTLAVTQPSRVGLGGGGACLVFEPTRGDTEAVMFLPGDRKTIPHGSDRPAAVPMLARGLFALYTRRPVLPVEQIMSYAEQAARFGTEVSRGLAADIAAVHRPLFADPPARAIFARPNGEPKQAGDSLVQPDLAATLAQMRVSGIGDMHQGQLARRLVAESPRAGGAITMEELKLAIPYIGVPLVLPTRGGDQIAFLPPPADGGLAAANSFEALRAGQNLQQSAARGLGAVTTWRRQGGDPRSYAQLQPSGGGALGTLPATSALVVLDRTGIAVSCAFTMNNLFGTGRIVPGMGVLLASAPGVGQVQPPLLSAAIAYNPNVRGFRFAAAASGQQDAAIGVAGPAALLLLRGEFPDLALTAGAIGQARTQMATCGRYLPGRPESCEILSDPRAGGVALGALDR